MGNSASKDPLTQKQNIKTGVEAKLKKARAKQSAGNTSPKLAEQIQKYETEIRELEGTIAQWQKEEDEAEETDFHYGKGPQAPNPGGIASVHTYTGSSYNHPNPTLKVALRLGPKT